MEPLLSGPHLCVACGQTSVRVNIALPISSASILC